MALTHRYRNWTAYEQVLALSNVKSGSGMHFSLIFLMNAGLIDYFLYSVSRVMSPATSFSRYFLAVSK